MAQPTTAQRPPIYSALTDKSLPELPIFPDDTPMRDVDSEDGDDEEDACPSPVVRKYDGTRTSTQQARSRVPQFRQSRRWARMHGWAGPGTTAPTRSPPPPESLQTTDAPQHQSDAEDRALTLREASFEQQRAQLKPSGVLHSSPEAMERPRLTSGSSSSSAQDGGFCRATASQYWRSVKTTVAMNPHGKSRKWRRRRSTKRTPMKPREATISRKSDRGVTSSKGRSANKMKVRHHARAPVPDGLQSTAMEAVQLSNDDHDYGHDGAIARYSRSSPIPSLHDPEKDSRFSEECRKILTNVDFNRDWMLPAASVLPAVRPPPVAVPRPIRQITSDGIEDSGQDVFGHNTRGFASQSTRARAGIPPPPRPIEELLRRQPAARKSSKTIGSLEAMLHMSKTRQPSAMSSQSDASEARGEVQAGTVAARRLSQSQSLLRLPSSRSTTGPSLQTLRSAMSMDTLARIETQFQDSWPSNIPTELKKNSFSSTDSKHSGPPSIPPERPLPALPVQAQQEAQTGTRHRAEPGSEASPRLTVLPLRTRKQPSDLQPSFPSDAKGRPSTDATSSSSLQNKSSLDSLDSSQSLAHNKFRGSRADRVKEKRMRDLASSRKSSIESGPPLCNEDAPTQMQTEVQPPNGAVPASSEKEELVDELDQFPSVPTSRPASMIHSHARGQSHSSRSGHLRQLSKASSNYKWPNRSRQVLSQSNIFVIVDSDPVTARFRAGTMSPSPSIGTVRRSESPSQVAKMAQASQPTPEGVARETNARDQEVSKASETSRLTPQKGRMASRSSSRRTSSSSDDIQPSTQSQNSKSSSKVSPRSKKRRRWNSTDLDLIKILQQDLEEYYGTILQQEEKIRWQAHQMQMMMRVMAPMNRVRGLKGPPYLEAIMDYPNAEEEQYSGQQENQIGSQSLNRSNSTGNDSTATASTESSKGSASADEGSMTDPCEHEPEPSPALKEKGPFRQPPPVAKAFPKGKQPATMSFLNPQTLYDGHAQEFDREPHRLSVNHALAQTEEMDRAIAQLRG